MKRTKSQAADEAAVARQSGKAPVKQRPQPEEESFWSRVGANVRTVGGAVLLAVFIRIVLFEAFEIEGPSMEPTLLNGDRVVVAKFLFGLFLPFTSEAVVSWDRPEVGDVVIVRSPAEDIDIVKRVIAVAGDTVELRQDAIYRNGRPIPRERLDRCPHPEELSADDFGTRECFEETLGEHVYVVSRSAASPPSSSRRIRVGEGHVYVLGDHRDRSNDSRNAAIGAVRVQRIKGKALLVYWSSNHGVRLGRLGSLVH